MKNMFWVLTVGVVLVLGVWFLGSWLGGCGSPHQETLGTSTTAPANNSTQSSNPSNSTSTTIGQSGSISGTVYWTPAVTSGTLFVYLWTDEDFGNHDLMSTFQQINLSNGQTSADYQFNSPGGPLKGPAPTPGVYFVMAMLYNGRSAQLFDDPATGDKLGQFKDGQIPIALGGSTHAQVINSSTSDQTGINIILNGTWPPNLSSTTTTTTVPSNANWQDIGGVTLSGTASNAAVWDIVSDSSGDIYVGGRFDSAGGVPANNIAKWNHSSRTWENLAGGLSGWVAGLAYDPSSGYIYAGGGFDYATNEGGSTITVNKIAKWDTALKTWSALGSGFSAGGDQILTMAVDSSGNVYAGGNFGNAGGVSANNIAEWHTATSTWDGMAGGVLYVPTWASCQIFDLTFGTDGNLYAGGTFMTSEAGPLKSIAKWNVSSHTWHALAGGIDGGVQAVAADNAGNIYAGGSIVGGSPVVQKWNGSAWQNFMPSDGGAPLQAIFVSSPNEIYAGRDNFTYDYIAKWNGSAWNNLTGQISGTSGGGRIVKALARDSSGNLYVGGRFNSAGGSSVSNIVKINNP